MITKIKKLKIFQQQFGLTLVELLISLALSLLLAAAAITMFVSNKETYKLQESLARMQENGRFALSKMVGDTRRAGIGGCGLNTSNTVDTRDTSGASIIDLISDFDMYVKGWELGERCDSTGCASIAINTATSDTTEQAFLTSLGAISGADVIRIKRPGDCSAPIYKHINASAHIGAIRPPDNCIQVCDQLAVTDCKSRMAVFVATNVNVSGASWNIAVQHNTGKVCDMDGDGVDDMGNGTKDLGGSFEGGEIIKIGDYTYFVKDPDGSGDRRPALYMLEGSSGSGEEIVEGVFDLQITYLEDKGDFNGQYDQATEGFVEASAVTDWKKVLAVRLNLLVETQDDELTGAAQNTEFPVGSGNTYNSTRILKPFSSTAVIRNKVL